MVPQGQEQGAPHHLLPLNPEEAGRGGVQVEHLVALEEQHPLPGGFPSAVQEGTEAHAIP